MAGRGVATTFLNSLVRLRGQPVVACRMLADEAPDPDRIIERIKPVRQRERTPWKLAHRDICENLPALICAAVVHSPGPHDESHITQLPELAQGRGFIFQASRLTVGALFLRCLRCFHNCEIPALTRHILRPIFPDARIYFAQFPI